ncbi:MAG: Spy/CpxP family protein refolding chaperone [Alphaproteobacteria bacterium]|nr:Spy/CpxP family protein refolding chaperone [Desulfovibrionaceae bacterium]MBF0514414.1 Spy/CpxP family protein refolding chaperone [Desulfovibrionaceae bacterium]MBF0562551.1 Spy/CpxP family protein refolding chaperone [Alphaproteobacteria bacterium]
MTRNSIQSSLLACVIGTALLIAAASPAAWAQKAPVPDAVAQTKVEKSAADWAEARIAKLHDNLHITAAQETAWQDVAKSMRENAASMKVHIEKWAEKSAKMTALESLKLHEEMAEEHAKAQRKLYPSFEKLYTILSPEQKTIADMVFARKEDRKHNKGM